MKMHKMNIFYTEKSLNYFRVHTFYPIHVKRVHIMAAWYDAMFITTKVYKTNTKKNNVGASECMIHVLIIIFKKYKVAG